MKIDPFSITNLFVNYTLGGISIFRSSRIQLGVNNLFDQHRILGVSPATTKTSQPLPGDLLNLEPGRSVALTITFGYAPNAAPLSR